MSRSVSEVASSCAAEVPLVDEWSEHERLSITVSEHVGELSTDERRGLGRLLASVERGRRLYMQREWETDEDLLDVAAYSELMRLAKSGVR